MPPMRRSSLEPSALQALVGVVPIGEGGPSWQSRIGFGRQHPGRLPATAWAGQATARFELRPLSLGEVLDRTFAFYRSRFWLFAGIS